MTSIEQKRKELEDNIKKSQSFIDNDEDMSDEGMDKYAEVIKKNELEREKLIGFNLGVELAQKEFLQLIYKSFDEWRENTTDSPFKILEKLEQSLGEKT